MILGEDEAVLEGREGGGARPAAAERSPEAQDIPRSTSRPGAEKQDKEKAAPSAPEAVQPKAAPEPEPLDLAEGSGNTTERLFFDTIQAGRLSALTNFLNQKTINMNMLSPSKKYRGMTNTEGWAALHFIAWSNHTSILETCLSHGALPETKNIRGQAPLHVAACRNSVAVAAALLQKGANPNVLNDKRFEQTPLHVACICGHEEVAQVLLKSGADVNKDNSNPTGPTSCLQLAIKSGNVKLVQLLLEHNPAFAFENGRSPFELAAVLGFHEILDLLLSYKKAHSSISCIGGTLAIMLRSQKLEMLPLIAKYSTIFNSSYFPVNVSPLCLSVSLKNVEILKLLVEAGVDLSNKEYAYLKACENGSEDIVEYLLSSNKVSVNYPSYRGNSGAHCAAQGGHDGVIKILLDKGIKLNEKFNLTGGTALHVSAADEQPSCIDAMVGHVDFNMADDSGQTALHIAANAGNYGAAKSLIVGKADVNVKNVKRQGLTPLHVAAMRGKNMIIKLLVENGANINAKKTVKQGPQTALEMARQSLYKITERLLLDLGAEDEQKLEMDHTGNTSVRLLRFDDEVPAAFRYPKDVVSRAEQSTSFHEHSSVVSDTANLPSNPALRSKGSVPWKTVRLFISSTFTDMQAERNHLVKYVIPTLRQKCALRRIHLVEVDLRWGVTEEEATSGKTVEICLSEVDKCLIFAGLVGDKYGWVPEANQIRDDIRVNYEWIQGHSITAMEINRGALKRKNDPKCYASFYFRDSSAILSKIPEKLKSQYKDDNLTKLNELKTSIQSTKFPIFKYSPTLKTISPDGLPELVGLETFGEAFIQNVWRAIETEYPEDEVGPSELEEERFYHEQFVEHKIANFVGRKEKIKEVKKLLDSNSTKQPIVIAGLPGSGKSALTSYLAHSFKESSSYTIFSHFIGASPASTDIVMTLKRLCQEIIQEYALWDIISDDMDYNQLKELFKKVLESASKSLGMKKLVVIIDAVNQLQEDRNKAQLLEWLPLTLPTGVRIIVSCLGGEAQDILRSRGHPIIEIGELSIKDREEIVTLTLARHHKKLDSDQMKSLMLKSDVSQPLYLVVCCEELRIFGIFEQLDKKIKGMAPTLPGLLDEVLGRLEQEHGRKLVTDVLSLLQCSRHGLIELEIVELLNLNSSVWGKLFLSLNLFLRPMGKEGQLDFFHRQIAKAVGRRYLASPERSTYYHKMLAEYYYTKCDPKLNYKFDITTSNKKFIEPYPRAITELTYHLTHAEMYKEIQNTLCNLPFIRRRALNGAVYALIADFNLVEDTLFVSDRFKNESSAMGIIQKIKEYKSFVQTNAPQIHEHPEGTLQIALNQSLSSSIVAEATKILAENKNSSYMEWLNRPPAGESGCLLMFQASMDVNDCVYSKDQKQILSTQRDGSVSVWSAVTGEEIVRIQNHKERANCVRFSKDGNLFASGAGDGLLNIYNSSSRHLIHQIKYSKGVNACDFSPDGTLIAIGCDDGLIELYSIEGFTRKTKMNHSQSTSCLSFSPNGKQLVSGSLDKNLIIWDIPSGKQFKVLNGHTKPVKSCHYSPNGEWILSAGQDKTLITWNAQTGAVIQSLQAHNDNIQSCAISPLGDYVVSGSWDRTARLWKVENAKLQRVGDFPGTSHFVNAVTFSPNGSNVVVGSPDHTIKIYPLTSAKMVLKSTAKTCKVHTKIIRGVFYQPKNKLIATGSWDKTIKIHQLSVPARRNADTQYITTLSTFSDHSKRVNEIAITNDGELLVSSSMDTTVRVWHIKTKEELLVLRNHTLNVFTVAITHDNRYVASASADGTIRLWNIETGNQVGVLTGHTDWVTALTFSPFSRRLISGSRDKTIKVWDSESGDLIETLEGHTNCILQIRYSPDGKYIVTVAEDKIAKIWDAFTLKLLRDCRGHTNEITVCAFFKNSKYFATGGSDRTVRIWETETGKMVWVYFLESGILGLDITEDNIILVGDSSGMLCVLEPKNVI